MTHNDGNDNIDWTGLDRYLHPQGSSGSGSSSSTAKRNRWEQRLRKLESQGVALTGDQRLRLEDHRMRDAWHRNKRNKELRSGQRMPKSDYDHLQVYRHRKQEQLTEEQRHHFATLRAQHADKEHAARARRRQQSQQRSTGD